MRKTQDLPVLPMIGQSPAMQKVAAQVDKVSRYAANVLLLGESGTGKDLLARTLHARGPRRAKHFVPQNCATLSSERLESELFGHERGSFTGAHERKSGLLELADGGSLFLDEVAELDLATQAKLLRVLEHGRFRRLGGTEVVSVDTSIISATHRDLPALISSGHFREDLYYRLKVVAIHVPPLRARKEDIPLLVASFIADFNRRHRTNLEGIAPALMKRFMRYAWPGNIRELRHAIESTAVMATGSVLSEADAEAGGFASHAHATREAGVVIPNSATMADAERLLIADRLRALGSRAKAAESLGIGLRTLYSRLQVPH